MRRETRWGTRVATLSIAAILAAACAPDSPTGLRSKIPPDVDRGFITGPLPFQTSIRTPEGELLEVCKDFEGEPPGGAGAQQVANFTITGNTSGAVSQSEGPFNFSLNDGECREIFMSEVGASSVLNISESGASGATTTSVTVQLYDGGIQAPGPTVNATSASGVTIAGERGALVIFTNVFPEVETGCTLTKGFWRNHPEATAARIALLGGTITVGGQTLTAAQAQAILNATPGQPGAITFTFNNLLNLTQQVIAAILNGGGSVIATALGNAQAAITIAGNKTSITTSASSATIGALIGPVSGFNEGDVEGFPHCDEE